MSEAKEKDKEAPAPAPSRSKLMPIVLVTNSLLLVGLLGVLVLRPGGVLASPASRQPHQPASAPARDEQAVGPTIKIDNIVVLLRSGPGAERYMRAVLEVELGAETDRDPVMKRMARIRDAIITYLSDRTLDDMRGSEGLEKTKIGLMQRLEALVPSRAVRALYLTEFVVQ